MGNPLAVIIPTRDRSHLLNSTLKSLAGQADRDFEVVVADHGSTDETREVARGWEDSLRLRYAYLSPEQRSPGWVRDEGTRLTDAGVFVFVDSGMLVPATFVQAHRDSHRERHAVGIGMCHGYRVYGKAPAAWPELLDTTPVTKLKSLIEADDELRDERCGISDFSQLVNSWVYGWSGNLSVGRDLYAQARGFDRDRVGIYEDVDLSYRLHACGGRFGIVDEGWAVHLPHGSAPLADQVKAAQAGWRLSFARYRCLAMEAAWLTTPTFLTWRADLREYGRRTDAMTLALHQAVRDATPVAVTPRELGLAGRVLLVGGRPQDAAHFDYVSCGRTDVAGDERVWGCAGVLIPLPAASLDGMVITDVWRRLATKAGRRRLLDHLIGEIARVAPEAVFLDSGVARAGDLTRQDLADACAKRGIRWRMVETVSGARR